MGFNTYKKAFQSTYGSSPAQSWKSCGQRRGRGARILICDDTFRTDRSEDSVTHKKQLFLCEHPQIIVDACPTENHTHFEYDTEIQTTAAATALNLGNHTFHYEHATKHSSIHSSEYHA